MSFILDALKKSENERQRQIGPSLADVQVTRRRQEKPWWVVAVAALLVINLGVLLIVLTRDGDAQPQAPAAPAQPQGAPTQQPAAAASTPASQYARGSGQAIASDPSVRSLADEAATDPLLASDPVTAGPLAAAEVPAGPPMVRSIEAPAVAPLPNAATFEARQAAAPHEVLPTLNDLLASGRQLPEMHLDIHVNAAKSADRFVFVNMRKYVEGQTLNEGPTIERITADGVILNQHGLRFLLPRQ